MFKQVTAASQGQRHRVGTFPVVTLYPSAEIPGPDPFLLFDHFGPVALEPGGGVGAHPHRGTEIGTYLLSGAQRHRDSYGNDSVISAGGVQWMTVGSGLIHAEEPPPQPTAAPLEGIQFWINLPAAEKLRPPRYQPLEAHQFPEVAGQGYRARVVAGTHLGAISPLQSVVPYTFLHLWLAPGGAEVPVAEGQTTLLYVLRGTLQVAGAPHPARTMLALAEAGTRLALEATAEEEAILLQAPALRESVAFQGPFVMNTPQEIREAYNDFYNGRMGKLDGVPTP